MNLEKFPALVLNADYRPLSLYPLELKPAYESIRNVYEETVMVVAEYDEIVRSPTITMRIPSVVALRQYVAKYTRVPFTRRNVFLRDRFRCQYCGEEKQLTFDHVVPRAHGGHTSWTNIVAACDDCNRRKGSRVDMEPMKVPREPTLSELTALRRVIRPKFIHPTWLDYIDLSIYEDDVT